MSTIPVKTSPIQSVSEWRKRSNSDDYSNSSLISKRQRIQYYYVLASESSDSEDDRSESVESIQAQETDLCRDTTDTDTKSELSDDDYDMKVEYEVVSSSQSEENPFADGSSSGEDVLLAAGAVAATIANDNDIDIWLTDDDETDSVSSIIEQQLFNNQTCKKCKIRKTVSCFPLCSHCYQIRKNCFPPRPRHKKTKIQDSRPIQSVTTDKLNECLTGLSQDSGLGSSQELQSSASSQQLQTLAWDKVVVPENLIRSTETPKPSTSSLLESTKSSLELQTVQSWTAAAIEMCIMCNTMPKNGIFVHSTGGHLCCCYNCAVKFWTKSKRCALCNLKVKNVIKAFLA